MVERFERDLPDRTRRTSAYYNSQRNNNPPRQPNMPDEESTSARSGIEGLPSGRLNIRTRMGRKPSSPMAPPFMVSAPGKAIVFGEHAVVHGKLAMAAAISLRSYLLVTTLSKSHRTVTLNFRDIGLDHTWDIDSLPWAIFDHPSKKKFYYGSVTSLDPELLEALRPHVAAVSPDKPEDVRKIHQNASNSFLYLFLSLGSRKTHAAIYTLRSTIPTGAGLGSSASVAVCISTALLLQLRTLSGPHEDQPADEAELQLERINRWAFVGELCIHGNPSGVDNTVSTGGKAVIFRRGDYHKPPTVIPILDFPELPLLLINSRQPRSTSVEVAKVAALREARPAITESILHSIDLVTTAAHEIIESDAFTEPCSDNDNDNDAEEYTNGRSTASSVEQLGELFRINHGLLVSLGTSHPRLERIREIVDQSDIGWTKLTGAGGGGCAITLLKSNRDQAAVERVEDQLNQEGFDIYKTVLGGDGVGVLWPAVLQNGTDEEGGEEIDQQKFENVVGNEGLERLVGVGGPQDREGWKFWKRNPQA
ncbi:Mevalonate kinase [Myotisia sp. PD_48]|nr:Mevalonate kinase [Myotisia sp. PD_48]